uniref:Envelope protein n=1 Tax=Takifugu rubripes TaxID=31033 RepID=A0A674MBS9_TAKRU
MSLQRKPLYPRRRTDLILMKFLCILGVISITAALPIVSPMPHEKPDLTTHPTAEWPLRERRQAPTTSPSSRCASGTAHLFIPQVCLLPNTWATVIVPLSSISNLENTAAGYAGNQWYMTNDQLDTGWHTLVADPPGQDWSSYTTTNSARRQRPLLTLTSTSNKLTLTVNLTKGSLLDDPDGSGCWLFLMWAWKDGTDPSFLLQLCVDRPNGTPIDPMPAVLSPKATSSGIKLVLEPTVDDYFEIMTGISGSTNNWLLLAEQAGTAARSDCTVCLGPRPVLRIVPPPPSLNATCLTELLSKSIMTSCSGWEEPFPVVEKTRSPPIFNADVAQGNFTCFKNNAPGTTPLGNVNITWCQTTVNLLSGQYKVARADLWWWCGGNVLRSILPSKWTGICAPVNLILPAIIVSGSLSHTLFPQTSTRIRRFADSTGQDSTYIDAIGIPRGVPDEYKVVNQIAAGFESTICWWCTINKNVDRINYIHYNVQRLANYTRDGLQAVHEQLRATSMMAFQNRLALDMLLAERGGVCSMFGTECCTFIPNNTAPMGKLTRAVNELRTLSDTMKCGTSG